MKSEIQLSKTKIISLRNGKCVFNINHKADNVILYGTLLSDVKKTINFLEKKFRFDNEYPFNKIYLWLEQETCDECIEYIVSIMMEPFDEIVKPLMKNKFWMPVF